MDVLIVWDVENVRVPARVDPAAVLAHLWEAHVRGPGRRCVGAYCAFSDRSRPNMHRFERYGDNGVLNARMLHATGRGGSKTGGTDHPLIDEMLTFAETCALSGRRGVIVMLSGDADFVRPALWCMQHGVVDVRAVYSHNASRRVCELPGAVEWRAVLDGAGLLRPRGPGGPPPPPVPDMIDLTDRRPAADVHDGARLIWWDDDTGGPVTDPFASPPPLPSDDVRGASARDRALDVAALLLVVCVFFAVVVAFVAFVAFAATCAARLFPAAQRRS